MPCRTSGVDALLVVFFWFFVCCVSHAPTGVTAEVIVVHGLGSVGDMSWTSVGGKKMLTL
jgi:hypothetical protein